MATDTNLDNLTFEQAKKNLQDADLWKPRTQATIDAGEIEANPAVAPTPQSPDISEASLNITSGGENLTSLTRENLLQQKADMMNIGLELIGQTSGEADRRRELTEESNVTDIREQATEYENQLAAEKRAFETQRRRMLENPEGLGESALNSRIANVERKSLQKQADIAILGNAENNNLETALTNIDSKLELEFGQAKENLKKFKQQIEFSSPFLGEMKSYLEDQAQQEEQELERQQEYKKEIMEMAVQAAENENPGVANSLIAMSNKGNVSFEDVQSATKSLVSSGSLAPKEESNLNIEQIPSFQEWKLNTGLRSSPIGPTSGDNVLKDAYESFKKREKAKRAQTLFSTGRVKWSPTDLKKLMANDALGKPLDEQLQITGYEGNSFSKGAELADEINSLFPEDEG